MVMTMRIGGEHRECLHVLLRGWNRPECLYRLCYEMIIIIETVPSRFTLKMKPDYAHESEGHDLELNTAAKVPKKKMPEYLEVDTVSRCLNGRCSWMFVDAMDQELDINMILKAKGDGTLARVPTSITRDRSRELMIVHSAY
jgi:hypothetical protein